MGLLTWLDSLRGVRALPLGSRVPSVKAPDHHGGEVEIAEACGRGLTLVYFYPKADTPGCTAQACGLRDAFSDLASKGVAVFGVSADTVEAQRRFREKFRLPFTLIADHGRRVIRAFGVATVPFVGLASRQSFLFRDGILVWRDLSAPTHEQAAELLRVLAALK